jgi:hypothetical protein
MPSCHSIRRNMLLRSASRLYIAIHHRSLTSLARSQLATFPLTGTSFLCINVQGISNAHHVLVFLVFVCLGPPHCRFAWILGTASSIETRPAASSFFSHSAHCPFVSPGWPSCHLITSSSTLPVHWPGFGALRICTISRPCNAQYRDSATAHHNSRTYVENWLCVHIVL